MNRRHLVLSLTSLSCAAGPSRAGLASKVLIQDAEIFRLPVLRGTWVIVRLRTNQGIAGLGDASHSGDDAQTAREIRRILELLRGRPVSSVEWLRSHLNGPSVAFSAIEQASWDIVGKIAGLPVSDLLGGAVHPTIRLYANINRTTRPRTPEAFAAMASLAIGAGFGAVKLAPFDELPKREAPGEPAIAAVRLAIGEADLMVDVHERFEGSAAVALVERLEEYGLYWLEETSPRLSDLAEIRRMGKIRTAGGEKLFGVKGVPPLYPSRRCGCAHARRETRWWAAPGKMHRVPGRSCGTARFTARPREPRGGPSRCTGSCNHAELRDPRARLWRSCLGSGPSLPSPTDQKRLSGTLCTRGTGDRVE